MFNCKLCQCVCVYVCGDSWGQVRGATSSHCSIKTTSTIISNNRQLSMLRECLSFCVCVCMHVVCVCVCNEIYRIIIHYVITKGVIEIRVYLCVCFCVCVSVNRFSLYLSLYNIVNCFCFSSFS